MIKNLYIGLGVTQLDKKVVRGCGYMSLVGSAKFHKLILAEKRRA